MELYNVICNVYKDRFDIESISSVFASDINLDWFYNEILSSLKKTCENSIHKTESYLVTKQEFDHILAKGSESSTWTIYVSHIYNHDVHIDMYIAAPTFDHAYRHFLEYLDTSIGKVHHALQS